MPDAIVTETTLHASCVALGDAGVLIMGPSGAGKSGLVLMLLDQPGFGVGRELLRGMLVADDQTKIIRRGLMLFASSPKPIAGLLEIRGQGIVALDHLAEVKLALVARLAPSAEIERMPDEKTRTHVIAGVALPEIHIDPEKPSAAARIRAALSALRQIRQD